MCRVTQVSFNVNMNLAMHLKVIFLLALPLSLLFGVAMAKNHSVVSITFSPSDSVASVDVSWSEVEGESLSRVPELDRHIEMGDPTDPVFTLEVGQPTQSSVTIKQRRLTGHCVQFDMNLFKLCQLISETVLGLNKLFLPEFLHNTPQQSVLNMCLCQASANGCILQQV